MVIISVVTGAVGLTAGYLLFANIDGEYLSLRMLIAPAQTLWLEFRGVLFRLADIRNNILLCGAAGAGSGLLGGIFT